MGKRRKEGTDMAPRHTDEPGTEPVRDTTADPRVSGTAAQPHVHEPGTPPHTHEAGYPTHPGHEPDAVAEEGEYRTVREEETTRTRPAGMAVRLIFTLLGAAGMIFGAFLSWLRFPGAPRTPGTEIQWDAFFYPIAEVDLGIQNFGPGAWLIVGGGLLALIGGFFGARRRVLVVERERVVP